MQINDISVTTANRTVIAANNNHYKIKICNSFINIIFNVTQTLMYFIVDKWGNFGYYKYIMRIILSRYM